MVRDMRGMRGMVRRARGNEACMRGMRGMVRRAEEIGA